MAELVLTKNQWWYNAQYSLSYPRWRCYDLLPILRPQHVLGFNTIILYDTNLVLRYTYHASNDPR